MSRKDVEIWIAPTIVHVFVCVYMRVDRVRGYRLRNVLAQHMYILAAAQATILCESTELQMSLTRRSPGSWSTSMRNNLTPALTPKLPRVLNCVFLGEENGKLRSASFRKRRLEWLSQVWYCERDYDYCRHSFFSRLVVPKGVNLTHTLNMHFLWFFSYRFILPLDFLKFEWFSIISSMIIVFVIVVAMNGDTQCSCPWKMQCSFA